MLIITNTYETKVTATVQSFAVLKGELNPKIDFLSFEQLGIVEQLSLYEFYFKLLNKQFIKI